jgi:hypothetical protein
MDPTLRFGMRQVADLGITAVDLRAYVARLESERVAAMTAGYAVTDAYVSDLEEELELGRALYEISAVTEIATLRGELFGPQLG